MAGKESALFETIRDTYFIDPHISDAGKLPGVAASLIMDFAQPSRQHPIEAGDHDSLGLASLSDVAVELSREYEAARSFDHLSVAQLHPSGNMLGILSHLASDLRNNNTIIGEVSPLETDYEGRGVRWLLEEIAGFDSERASGSLVSGGTLANLTGLLVAREVLQDRGWAGDVPATVFASKMNHYSIDKAAKLLAPRGIITVDYISPVSGGYTMDPMELREKISQARKAGKPILALVAAAGETETGLVEDLTAMAEIAKQSDVYLHVDGAYGAPYRMSRAGNLFDGMSSADSITCDPHKYLYVPYNCGSILFADGARHTLLERFNEDGADYMYKTDEAQKQARADRPDYRTYLGSRRIEGSSGGSAASALYTTIRHIGRKGFASLLNHNLDMAEVFSDEIRQKGGQLKLTFEPSLNTVCVEPADGSVGEAHPYANQVEDVSAMLEKEFGIYLAAVSLPNTDGKAKRKVFRFVATHPHTNENDVRYIADSLITSWENYNV